MHLAMIHINIEYSDNNMHLLPWFSSPNISS